MFWNDKGLDNFASEDFARDSMIVLDLFQVSTNLGQIQFRADFSPVGFRQMAGGFKFLFRSPSGQLY